MKKKLSFLLFLPFLAMAGTPKVIDAKVNKVYIPFGYDTNDDVSFIVTGWHPNSCVKDPKVSVDIDMEKFIVEVNLKTMSYHKSNPFCPSVITPFKYKVKLGKLDSGLYSVYVNDDQGRGIVDELSINKAARERVDSYEYPLISKVIVMDDVVRLETYIKSNCFTLDRIKVLDDGENTYSVLPMLKKMTNFCPMKLRPYSITFDKPESLNSKKAMLHIRSTGGSAINKIIEN